ncbi:CbtA family protein [Halorubellus sp. PRR65]|uniref:CbtA family protein n=1 Tax=Halorubellus sp. PRR65 TaxID=3098148 RepID=UPI002B262ECC|nr:CbtA family protein [Halorubellus sp. PRR65]
MFGVHVRRGLQAGALAGLAFGLLVALVANPLVGYADELAHADGGHAEANDAHRDDAEAAHADGDTTHQSDHHESAVSMPTTNAVSVLAGVLWGVLLGGVVFGAAFALLEPAIPGSGATRSYVLAAAGFVTVSGAPWLVLPPQPPGVEHALATDARIALYAAMMVAGALACLLAGGTYRRLRARRGRVVATTGAALSLGVLAVPALLAPSVGVSHSLPGALATGLTGLVVVGQALLWLLLATVHALLRQRDRDATGGSTSDETENAHAPGTTDGALAAD